MLRGARSPNRPSWTSVPPRARQCQRTTTSPSFPTSPLGCGRGAAPLSPIHVTQHPGPGTLYGDESLTDLCLLQCSVSNFMGCISRVIESRCPQNATAAHRKPQGTGLVARTRVCCKHWPRKERKIHPPPPAWGCAGMSVRPCSPQPTPTSPDNYSLLSVSWEHPSHAADAPGSDGSHTGELWGCFRDVGPTLSLPAVPWKEQGTKAEARLPILYHLSYPVAMA